MVRQTGPICIAVISIAASAYSSERVDDFLLLDHTGKAQHLYYHDDASAIVIMAQDNACPAMADTVRQFEALAARYPTEDVVFWLLDPGAGSTRGQLRQSANAENLKLPVLEDESGIIGESLGLRNAGEVLVIDPVGWRLAYQGPLGTVAPDTADKDVQRIIASLLAGGTMESTRIRMDGCAIEYPGDPSAAEQISYSETIAPLLKENCAYCHVEGGIGPWAMTSYNMVRGFAPMIREVVRTRRMPPWQADPHVGTWQGDRSLSPEQARTLVHWIEAGAPRGEGADPLQAVTPLTSEWPLGKPDLVINVPGFEVPASGVVDYQFPYVKNELDHGVWIRAATVLPGDRSVVHHVLAGSVEANEPPSSEDSVMDNYIIGYAPGVESYVMPQGTGVYVAPGGFFTFQMHYTPTGKATLDETRMGLYLSEAPPANFLRHQVVVSPAIEIPPNAANHEEAAYFVFHDDAVIHTLFPHAHYRGKAASFELLYPDGHLETLLSVPHYDFNWQRGYDPVNPIAVPAGSRLIYRTVYDNSAQNPANPDPARTVPWGLQSWDEMLYGAFSYSWTHETTSQPIHDRLLTGVTLYVGFLDKNMDGKVSWREMPTRLKKQLIQGFSMVDTNGDGGLDIDEFVAMQKARQSGGAD